MDLSTEITAALGQLSNKQQQEMLQMAGGMLRDNIPAADHICNSWKEVLDVLEAFPSSRDEWVESEGEFELSTPKWAFRGQARASWPLATSLDRFTSVIDQAFAEQRLVRAFRAKARLHNAAIRESDESLEWLSLMQHHGAPTRLLDFTYSPYVAAYFALQDPQPKDGYAVIWAIDLRRMNKAMHRVYAALAHVPRDPSGLLKVPCEYVRVAREEASLGNAGSLQKLTSSGYVVPVHPATEHLRLSNQQGLFLLNGVPELSFEDSLRKMLGESAKSALKRIAIDRSTREGALRNLQQMNVNHLSLFPGLDGLAKFVTIQAELFSEHEKQGGPE